MTLPSKADLNTYGGAKTNHAPLVDPSKQESADHRNDYVLDVAQMTNTQTRG